MAHPSNELRFSSQEEANAYLRALSLENEYHNIAGLDECGCASYAGPVVAACVLLPPDHGIEGIKDSKKLSPARRRELSAKIKEKAYWGIGAKSNSEVDRLNVRIAAEHAAAQAALNCLYAGAPIDLLLCDGGLIIDSMVPFSSTTIIKGDLWFESIAAASIVGKVYRDGLMLEYHKRWPEYSFDTNQGYGTKIHLQAIETYGITPIHRKSYRACRTAWEREDG